MAKNRLYPLRDKVDSLALKLVVDSMKSDGNTLTVEQAQNAAEKRLWEKANS
jgi:hypothetical protein